jgi:hypothetical protein
LQKAELTERSAAIEARLTPALATNHVNFFGWLAGNKCPLLPRLRRVKKAGAMSPAS